MSPPHSFDRLHSNDTPFPIPMKPRAIAASLAFAFLPLSCGAAEIPQTRHYGMGMGWLQFDYPASFTMDPKSHEGEAKWWARLVAPDRLLSIEASSFGYCPESLKDEEGYKSPEDYLLRAELKGFPQKTSDDGYDRFIRVDSASVTVVFLKQNADWGRCYQELRFSFPDGSYEMWRPAIMRVIESAEPAYAAKRRDAGSGKESD